jgi:tetratricopeptide (TPR) repeat protein
VCNIAGRTDLLASVFALGSVLAALRFRDMGSRRQSWLWGAAAVFCFFCALLSKESAVAVLAAVPLAWAIFPMPEGEEAPPLASARNAAFFALLLAALGAYAFLRNAAGARYGTESLLPLGEASVNLVAALGYYARKVVFPWPQNHFVARIPDLATSLAVLTLAAAALGVAFRRLSRAGRRQAAFSILWFLLFLAPALAVAVGSAAVTPVAERYLYLPSAGFCLLLAQGVSSADSRRMRPVALGLLAGGLALAYAASTVERTGVWSDNLSFWQDVARDPAALENPVVLSNLAVASKEANEFDEARRYAGLAYENFQDDKNRQKIAVLFAEIEVREARMLFARGEAAQASERADKALGYLEPLRATPMANSPSMLLATGYALLVKARTRPLAEGMPDRDLLASALKYFDLAARYLPGDHELAEARAECFRLLEPR